MDNDIQIMVEPTSSCHKNFHDCSIIDVRLDYVHVVYILTSR